MTLHSRNYKREWVKRYRKTPKGRAQRAKYIRGWRLRTKLYAIKVLGGECRCCGEDYMEFLTIDHINGGGTKHRKEWSLMNANPWKAVERLKFPPEYRLLCYNCNQAIAIYKTCPHKKRGKK